MENIKEANDAVDMYNVNTDDVLVQDTVATNDPYAYLDRGEFTSEKFKIEIRGLPKFYGIGELKRLLNDKLKLGCSKVKPPRPGSRWAYVCFRSEEDRKNALLALNGYVWKSKKLSASIAQPAPDPLVKKRKEQSEESKSNEDQNNAKIPKIDAQSQEEKLKSTTIPLWNIPYTQQVENKQEVIKQMLMKLGEEMLKSNPNLKVWLDRQKKKFNGLPCNLWDIRTSPVCYGYRNKCEFTIGKNEETGERTIGFRLGSYVSGFVGVAPVDCLLHIPDQMKQAAKVLEKFVQASEFDVFNPVTHEGTWRQLTARLSMGTGELMLIVGIHPQQLSEIQLGKLKADLKDFFTNGEGKTCNVTSLYFQKILKRKPGEEPPPLEHLHGDTHIHEVLHGLTFHISPEAFFQVNTAATEILYSTIAEIASLSEKTALLDICCGTGSIGLCLAKHCSQVLGVELSEKAVKDARLNADANKINNCEFFVGRAEDIVTSVVKRVAEEDVLAIVDPPRAGLHLKAVHHLRNTTSLNKLIFVSCDPKAAMGNFLQLCRPASKTYRGSAFVPVQAVPIDLFPHTPHCELVMYFERLHPDVAKSAE